MVGDGKESSYRRGTLKVCRVFGIESLNMHQDQALRAILMGKRDTYVNLPTDFGKSLIYQALTCFDDFTSTQKSIVVVVSPLINLMMDQVNYLNSVGIKAVCISFAPAEEKKRINGKCYMYTCRKQKCYFGIFPE